MIIHFCTNLFPIDQVGRSYGRVVVYCSNFERTTADALFFESLLYLARLVVAAAVAQPWLTPEVRPCSNAAEEPAACSDKLLNGLKPIDETADIFECALNLIWGDIFTTKRRTRER